MRVLVNLPNRVQICLLSKLRQIGTRAWWTRVLHKVLESTKLGYQSAYFENYHAFGTNYADWYPSLVDSGTSQSTRVHQTRVLICLILEIGKFVPGLVSSPNSHGYSLFFFFLGLSLVN